MPDSAIIDLVATPVRVNTPARALGDEGDAIWLLNSGDDPVFWSLGSTPPATGEPGFKIDPAGRHTITLPARSLPLWAWAPSRSRLVTAPYVGRGTAPTSTIRMTIDAVPRRLSEPDGWGPGSAAILRVVGAGPISFLFFRGPAGRRRHLAAAGAGDRSAVVPRWRRARYMAVDPALCRQRGSLPAGRSPLEAVSHGAPGWRRASR